MSTASKSIGIALFILTALILVPSRPVAAEVYVPATLYSQPPDPTGGLYQSSWWSPDESDSDKYLWDNFTLTYTQDITEIQWRGGYDPNVFNGAGAVVDFEVAIFASNGAEPDYIPLGDGKLVSYQTGGNAGETLVGNVGGFEMYDYAFTLPATFQAQGGITYWVYIVAEQTGNPDWGLSKGTNGDTQHFRVNHDGSIIEYRSGDLAFTLLGPPGMVCGIRGDTLGTPYTLGNLSLNFTAIGSDLDCVEVTNWPINHPSAPLEIQTGQYWEMRGLQDDRVTAATTDFQFNLTLPHNVTPNTNAFVCKYLGGTGASAWDCGRTNSNGNFVSRNGITGGFSDWAVGNGIPTAFALISFSASPAAAPTGLAVTLMGAFIALAVVWKLWRKRQLE